MSGKRSAFDPLQPTTAPRWQVVRSMHGSVIESTAIPAGADLKRFFIKLMLKWIEDGWEIGEFSSNSGTFFCNRHPERRMVSISPTDPQHNLPMYRASHRGGCTTCGD